MIAGYRVIRTLGSGGMGAVYLVANPELPRNDALKLLSAELSRDPSFRARFDREASVASQLDHPNITSIYRRGTTADGQLWIAMQFIDGTDADAALRAGTMTPNRAVHIVREVAKALDYAHNRQVIHRDVKPANFLLSGPIGPDERVVLADFGIARAVDDASITSTGAVMATLAYAAPEVLLGRRVDGRTDTYSLACSLYRMLTGKTPYQEFGSSAAVMNAHLNYPPPRVTEANPNLPQALDQALATAMAKDPNARFQSSGAFANAVAAAFQPTPAPQSFHGSPPSHPGYAAHPSPQFAAPNSGGWQPQAPASSGSSKRPLLIAGAVGVAALLGLGVVGFMASGGGDDTKHSGASTTTSATPTVTAKPIKPADLAPLLPDVTDMESLIGASDLELKAQGTAVSQATAEDGGVADRPECLGVMYPLRAVAYDGTGYSGAWGQRMEDTTDPVSHVIQQSVAAFPTAAQAEDFVNNAKPTWQKCGGTQLRTTFASGEETFAIGTPTETDNTITLVAQLDAGSGWACSRALGAKNNVVFDINACGYGVTDEAEQVMNEGFSRVSMEP
ncbi:serine/threonine-protein kinase PknH/PknJ [Mycolicibacterium brumae]|uniref:serine/threonine-protein kinase PknH/PknJ n=1 Tax=Mycolicibacterium brumae TaxID=85968 RepID=UPI0021AF8A9F|nr:serine/threonine-protein kinase PknH/PknJ [Mycolicibacterium brumae]